MNFNLDLYEKTEGKEFGEFESLALGGHEIIIMDAREYTSPITSKTSLKVCVDIAGKDEQAGYFKKQYENNKDVNDKWPSGATRYLSLNDEQIAYLKGFITAVENSNKDFKFNTKGTWEQLKGKRLAGQFGLEEYQDQEGNIKTATKITQFRSLDKLSEIKIPRVKLLDGSYVEYENYKPNTNSNLDNVVEVTADMLPF